MPIHKIKPIIDDNPNCYFKNRAYIAEEAKKRRKEIKEEFQKYLEEERKKIEGKDSN